MFSPSDFPIFANNPGLIGNVDGADCYVAIYIDENLQSGVINGLLVTNPASLQQIIYQIQDRFHIYDEIKHTRISKYKVPLYKEIINAFHWYEDAICIYKSYKNIILGSYYDYIKEIVTIFSENTKFLIFIDYFNVPSGVKFEEQIKKLDKKIVFVLREDSKSNKLLQLSDLHIGLLLYLTQEVESGYKKEIQSHVQTYHDYFDKKCFSIEQRKKKLGYSIRTDSSPNSIMKGV